jgi:hypothetical protein
MRSRTMTRREFDDLYDRQIKPGCRWHATFSCKWQALGLAVHDRRIHARE